MKNHKRFLQFDAGVATCELFAKTMPKTVPAGRMFVDVTDRPDAVIGSRLNGDVIEPPSKR